MVIGKDMLYFAFVSSDTVVDSIPLAEILQIKKMGANTTNESPYHSKSLSLSHEASFKLLNHHFVRSIRLDTSPEGFNSGRTYYLQANTDDELELLIQKLSASVKDAIKRFEARSLLERSQKRARAIYNSRAFQYTAATFVLVVRGRAGGAVHPCPRPPPRHAPRAARTPRLGAAQARLGRRGAGPWRGRRGGTCGGRRRSTGPRRSPPPCPPRPSRPQHLTRRTRTAGDSQGDVLVKKLHHAARLS